MGSSSLFKIGSLFIAIFMALPAVAKPLKKSEANRILPEGEYLVKSGRRVRGLPSRSLAKSAKKTKKTKSSPRVSAKKRSNKSVAKARTVRKPDRRKVSRIDRSKTRTSRRDLPLVSAPRHRVSRPDRMIVMEDPAAKSPLPKPAHVGAIIRPDQTVLDPAGDAAPSEVDEAKAAAVSPVVGPAPASVAEATGAEPTTPREPDAFDLHSGKDPMQGP